MSIVGASGLGLLGASALESVWLLAWATALVPLAAYVAFCVPLQFAIPLLALLAPFSIRAPMSQMPFTTTAAWLFVIAARITVPQSLWLARIGRTELIAIVFVGFSLFTGAVGIDPINSLRKWMHLASFLLVLLLTNRLVDSRSHLLNLTRAMMVSGALLAAFGLAQVLLGVMTSPQRVAEMNVRLVPLFEGPNVSGRMEGWRSGYYANWISTPYGVFRAVGTSFSPMAFAQIVTPSFFPVMSILINRHAPYPKPLAAAFVLLTGAAIVATFSRGAWLTLCFGCAVLGLCHLLVNRHRTRRPLLRLATMATLLAMSVLIVTPSTAFSVTQQAIVSIIRPRDSEVRAFNVSNQARFATYEAGLAVTRDHPFLGVGPGNFARAIGQGDGANTHNAYLTVSAEMGMCGVLLYVLLLAMGCRNFWLAGSRFREPLYRSIAFGWLAAITSLMVYWLFTGYVYEPKLGVIVWLVLGVSVAARRIARRETTLFPTRSSEP